MSFSRTVLLWMSENKRMREKVPSWKFVKKAVKKFMPGENSEDALKAASRFDLLGIPTVFTHLGENITNLDEGCEVCGKYLKLIDSVAEKKLNIEISLKLTQLGFDLSEEETLNRFKQITRKAKEKLDNVVWIDMEGSAYTQRTIEFYKKIKNVFGAECEILTVTKDGRAISSVMSFYFRDEVLPYYGGGTSEAREFAANDFMYWELMRRAAGRGIRIFDFGRSKKGTGSYDFKGNWGFEPQPLYYEHYLLGIKEMPEINPLNPKYQLFIRAWKAMPYALTKIIGPMVAKNLG